MEHEGSLPCSEDPASGPYPEPDESSPPLLLYFFEIHSGIILSSMPVSYKWSLLLRFSEQNFVHISHLSQARYIQCSSYHP